MKFVSAALFAGIVSCMIARPVQAAAAFTEKVLWSFGNGADGKSPSGLAYVKGVFYGTTGGGGVYDRGTAYSFDPSNGSENLIRSFCLKGEYCLDGSYPHGSLLELKGKLIGTAQGGGANCLGEGGCGTVYSLNPITGRDKIIYSFAGAPDGQNPASGLIDLNGILYGTTGGGGMGCGAMRGCGTAYSIDPITGVETMLYSFCSQQYCTDGSNAGTPLIAVNGVLYGTTVTGGADHTGCQNIGCGTVFSIDPTTGVQTVLHSFQDTDGAYPESSLIAVNGLLYGTTSWGGGTGCFHGYGCGTVFSIDPGTGNESVVYSFCSQQNCADGSEPYTALIEVNGMLYGTTPLGGSASHGTVYSIDPTTGAETVVYSFAGGTDGATPLDLIAVRGSLYGVTQGGGAYGYGTIFELEKQ